MTTTEQRQAIQRASAFCRLHMLGELNGRAALLEMVVDDGPQALAAFVESLTTFAATVQLIGRGHQPVKTREQLLAYFEDMATFQAMGGVS